MLLMVAFILADRRFKSGCAALLSFKIFSAPHSERLLSFKIRKEIFWKKRKRKKEIRLLMQQKAICLAARTQSLEVVPFTRIGRWCLINHLTHQVAIVCLSLHVSCLNVTCFMFHVWMPCTLTLVRRIERRRVFTLNYLNRKKSPPFSFSPPPSISLPAWYLLKKAMCHKQQIC